MPQSKEVHKEYMRKLRGSQSITKKEGFTAEGSQDVMPNENELMARAMLPIQLEAYKIANKEYPAILYALIDPDKRKKLERVVHSLKEFRVADKVFYGCRSYIPMDVVGDYLEATEKT